jgi:hypothetical protein
MKAWLVIAVVAGVLTASTVAAVGGGFYGWFLPDPLEKPVSLRDGSSRARGTGLGYYFIGRSHYGGGFRGGK